MSFHSKIEYVEFNNATFFTIVLLPEKKGSFPTVVFRSPYVQNTVDMTDNEVEQNYLKTYNAWLDRGYAVVFQHCRGQGKSTGDFVPYIYEREDGLALRSWIREQKFYNGEIYLCGGSYTASLHYSTAPFENDIKGAVFEVQDSERYRLWYRNGQMRKGHANWHFALYKEKAKLNKNFSMDSFAQLPLKNLSQRVLTERAEDFEQMLFSAFPLDKFWETRYGGIEAKNATDNTNVPILFTTGYNDFYVGGMFKMWNQMSEKTKQNCAMLVSPYNHGDGYSAEQGIAFSNGSRAEQFGSTYQIDWFDNVRKGTLLPYNKGEITYYRTFENRWQSSFYSGIIKSHKIPLGEGTVSFCYDPLNPPTFSPEGNYLKDLSSRKDVITIYLQPFEKDVFIKGQIRAVLSVSSNCEDTSFYMNISIKKPKGDYVLRHDITSIGYQIGKYVAGQNVELEFCFDEYAFLLKKGECLRIDVASTDNNTYVSHTNQKGQYCLQTKAVIATNKVNLSCSRVILPIEE